MVLNSKKYSRRGFIAATSIGVGGIMAHNGSYAQAIDPNQNAAGSNVSIPCIEDATWVKIDGKVYGAQPDERGPIGGGVGYKEMYVDGDYHVEDFQSLVDALNKAQPGQVVFIPSGCMIDLTTHVYIEKFVLEIPAGVTLASDRGYKGNPGAVICSDVLDTPRLIRPMGPHVRITGVRIQGPNGKRYMEHHQRSFGKDGLGKDYYQKFPVSRGIWVEHDGVIVDNCEISAFSHAAIRLVKGQGHRIHHNYIHHCQYNGLGYGVSHSKASSSIEYNLFDSNRHSIAGTGERGCGYTARNNVECGVSLNHCFDMHGGEDRKDETHIAGTSIVIANNTFRAPKRAVSIRGEPEEVCEVYQNWFVRHQTSKDAVRGYQRTHVFDNLYGEENKKVY